MDKVSVMARQLYHAHHCNNLNFYLYSRLNWRDRKTQKETERVRETK